MRKMEFMEGLPRYTITYCQYGDTRMKPTDIWTNHPNPQFKPPCKNGDKCHTPAPRGAKMGTQGLTGSVERAKIPIEFCNHIVDICEERTKRAERKGHWKHHLELYGMKYECTICKSCYELPYSYCPSCGARMERE